MSTETAASVACVTESTPDRSISRRISRRVRVGEWIVDALFSTPRQDDEASLSRQAACLAEDLAATALGLDGDSVRLASVMPSGRPILLVDGVPGDVSVSMSHLQGLVGAGLCGNAWVGLDIVDPVDAGRGLDAWFTPDELSLLPDDLGLLRAMLWAAKEAAYKASHLDTEFRPRTVLICDLSMTGFSWVAHDRFADVRGAGCFMVIHRHVVAVAATVPRRSRSLLQTRFPETLDS